MFFAVMFTNLERTEKLEFILTSKGIFMPAHTEIIGRFLYGMLVKYYDLLISSRFVKGWYD